ncbi:OLC1v1004322C1 [Oldenlandia corymbosa var. corymbosa]|uniref:OLC1v1004322C1 n=1 Tax=Oldenlandia corymbosa var. corymbosa TaxID=529605 RepID=A0AAV1DC21_OLDCO|nr:OLC1v1004322C1 [Oldenlandia corymbosa var. corymbosa]
MNRLAIVILFIISSFLTLSAAEHGDGAGAYEILKSYNFPVGLLPKGAREYDLDEKTGKFNAYFNDSCSFSLEGSYQLKYKSKISGYIAKGKLSQLSGISVKVLFLWLNIVEVVRNGDDLEFSVGIASADFAVDNFDIIPQCGCGLNCNNGGLRRTDDKKILGRASLVSSI